MLDLGQGFATTFVGRVHNLRMKCAGHGQGLGLHRPQLRGQLGCPQTGLGGARHDENVWSEEIGNLQNFALPGLLAKGFNLARSMPIIVTMPLDVASAASCIAAPRSCTVIRPSSKSMMPAKTMAVYSPRLSPAAASQDCTTSGVCVRNDSRAARLVTNNAGWL